MEKLKFKCILDTEQKRINLQEALIEIGIKWNKHNTVRNLTEPLLVVENDEIRYVGNTDIFESIPLQTFTYESALKTIEKFKKESSYELVQFDIAKNGYFMINDEAIRYDNYISAINRNEKLIAYAGIQFIEPISGELSLFSEAVKIGFSNEGFIGIIRDFHISDGILPVFPYKIGFWARK